MPATLNFFDTYTLMAINEENTPRPSFFRDRYFPTGEGDIFHSDKVLTEYRKGDRKLAAFISDRASDIPMDRRGYAIHEYQPARIAPSRLLTLDDLRKRGFGEALYANATAAERAARLLRDDMADMDRRIAGREEWMCAQVMINNACTMQTYIDNNTQGETQYVQFYDSSSDHAYTISSANYWDAVGITFMAVRADVRAMCRKLTSRGLPATDLVLGVDAADALLAIDEFRDLIDKNSGFAIGAINEQLSAYDGVTFEGVINFGGHRLNVITVDETYIDNSNVTQRFFPTKAAMVTAPGCGHLMYGQITQIDYGATEHATYAAKRVPKLVVDQPNDERKLRLAARPLAAPKDYSPFIYASQAVS